MAAVILQHNPFVSETHRELRMLRHFVEATEYGLKAAREANHAEIGALFDKCGEDAEVMILSHGSYHAEVHHEEIPRALRYSQAGMIFFTLETRLMLLCDHIYDHRNGLPKRVGEIKGNSQFAACRTFLSDFIDDKVTVWEPLDLARLVRNCIGHGNGFPTALKSPKDQAELRAGIQATPTLALDAKDRMVVKSDYISHLLLLATTLFEDVFSNLGLGGESPLDYIGPPESYAFLIDRHRKEWKVLGPEDSDLPREEE